MNKELSKCGTISVVGRTNVGKSTLINKLLGEKVFITSRKPQTTRNRILGISTKDNSQAIYIDTPGVHQGEERALNKYMNKVAFNSLNGVDTILFVVERLKWTNQDQLILDRLPVDDAEVILVINKVDQLLNKEDLLPYMQEASTKYSFSEMIPISALKNKNVDKLQDLIFSKLPEGEHSYPRDQIADVPEKFLVSELIREKCITRLGDELPYRISVMIDNFKRSKKIIDISAILYVEKNTQKGILVGHQGQKLKSIGTSARKDIENFLDSKVMLRLWVKVKKDWTNDSSLMASLGYLDD